MKKHYVNVNNLRGFANEKIYVAVLPNKKNKEFLIEDITIEDNKVILNNYQG